MKKYNKKILLEIILTIISAILVFTFLEGNFFKKEHLQEQKVLFIYVKVSFCIFLFYFWHVILRIVHKLRTKDNNLYKFLKYLVIYLSIETILLLLIYPGFWIQDEAITISQLSEYKIDVWHNVITQIYYSIPLLVFSNPIFIVIFQFILISMIMSYIQTRIEIIYNRKLYNILLLLISFMPSILIHTLCMMRLGMYSYVLLLLFAIFILDKKQKVKLNLEKAIYILALSALTILWRSEGIIFIIILPILLYVTYSELRKVHLQVYFLVLFILLKFLFDLSISKYINREYDILPAVNPLSVMLNDSKVKVDGETLRNIDKVIDIGVLLEYPSVNGTPSYFLAPLVRENYEEHLPKFWRGFAKVVFNNFRVYLGYRAMTYSGSNALYQTICFPFSNYYINNDLSNNEIVWFCNNYNLYAIDASLKGKVENFLVGGYALSSYDYPIIRKLFWNITPLIFILVFVLFFQIKNKDYLKFLINTTIMTMFIIVFFTEPASVFRYFLPQYLSGIFLVYLTLIDILELVRNKSNKKLLK